MVKFVWFVKFVNKTPLLSPIRHLYKEAGVRDECTLLKAWSAGGVAAADVMMLDVAIDLFKTEDTTKGILNSAKAIEAGVQPSPLTFLGR